MERFESFHVHKWNENYEEFKFQQAIMDPLLYNKLWSPLFNSIFNGFGKTIKNLDLDRLQ